MKDEHDTTDDLAELRKSQRPLPPRPDPDRGDRIAYLMRKLSPDERAIWTVLNELVEQHLELQDRVERLETRAEGA